MINQREPSDTSTVREDNSEFKVFRQIEDTIEGSIDFAARFVRTSITLAIKPKTILVAVAESGATAFSRPYTYLAISVFLSVVVLRTVLITITIVPFHEEVESLPIIIDALRNATYELTFESMLMMILPTVTVVLIIGAIFGWRTRRRFGRPEGMLIVCYTAGFQIILLTVVAGLILKASQQIYTLSLLVIFPMLGVVYSWVGPAYVLFTFTESCKTDQEHVPRRTARKILGFINALVVSGILLYSSFAISLKPHDTRIDSSSRESVVEMEIVESQLSADGTLAVTLTIQNMETDATILRRTGATSTIEISSGSEIGDDWEWKSDKVELHVRSWDSGESPVLILEPGVTRWIQVVANLGEAIGSKARNIGDVDARLNILFTTTPKGAVWTDFTVDGIDISDD